MTDDYDIDQVWKNLEKKKKVNSGSKGKRGEREIVNLLNERFQNLLAENPDWGLFARSVGSGNRWSQATLSKDAANFYSGDIICTNFRFVIESKNGYDDIDFITAFEGNKKIDEFLRQVEEDSRRSNKKPMLIWKKDRKKPLAFIKEDVDGSLFEYKMYYKDWMIVDFSKLINNLPDEFFFIRNN